MASSSEAAASVLGAHRRRVPTRQEQSRDNGRGLHEREHRHEIPFIRNAALRKNAVAAMNVTTLMDP